MKPHLLALASCGALLLSACPGPTMTGGGPQKPGSGDPEPCQKELPELVDHVKGEPLGGGPDSVTIVEPDDDGTSFNLYVVNPKDGTVDAAVRVNRDDTATIIDYFGDRGAGSIIRPTPPPPPGGWDHLRWLLGIASRHSQTWAGQCKPPQPEIPRALETEGPQ